jgi:hypothetical protein
VSDAVTLLIEKRDKVALSVKKLRAKLEAAEAELVELETAAKVLTALGLFPEVVIDDERVTMKPSDAVFASLPFYEEQGKAPREISAELTGVSAENVRTILSRLVAQGKAATRDGRYWRIALSDITDDDEVFPGLAHDES